MMADIKNCNISDMHEIFRLYKLATDFQKTRYSCHWPDFEKSLIETEILEQRQWKITMDGKIACVWATAFSDPQIWEERNSEPSVYLHRIATNPEFRGNNFVKEIVKWAEEYADINRKNYVRLDTVGDNSKLIAYYEKCGFSFLGSSKLANTRGLPAHYDVGLVSLFQIDL